MTTLNSADALPIGKLCLSRLRRQCSSADASQWTETATAVNDALVRLITAGVPAFWATLVYKEDVRLMLDSVADFYIRVSFFNESTIYLVDERVKALYEKIYENNFFVYLRVLSYESNQKLFATPTAYADALYGRRVISVQRLVKMASIYGRANQKLCAALVANTFVVEPRFHNDLNDFIVTTEQFFERAKSFLDDLSGSLENRRVALDISHALCLLRILDNAVNVALSLTAFMRFYSAPVARHGNTWLGFLNNLPPLIDHVTRVLSDAFLALVARCAPAADASRFLGYLAHRRTLLLQSIMQLFFSFYNSTELSEKDRLMTLYDAVVCKEFLVRFDDAVGVRKEFSRFLQLGACNEEHLRTAEKLLNDAYAERARAIKTSLAQKRVLKNIGQPTAAGLKEMLLSLTDLLPNYSPAQLHLCLKHFNYDADRATYALMEPAEMPLDLRILMRAIDRFDDVNLDTVVVLPAFTDQCRDDFDVDSLEKENDPKAAAVQPKESAPTAFSILPDDIAAKLPRPPPTSAVDAGQAKERSSKLETIVSRYGDMFDLSNVAHIIESIDRAKTNDVVRELVVENKVLVQPNLERRKLMADKPALTAKEESAIRTTYNRYKYEMSDEDDEDGRYDLEERYAASVGRTGRFNKPQVPPQPAKATAAAPSTVAKPEPTIAKQPTQPRFADEDDEYDDTYDDPDLFAVEDDDNEKDDDKAAEQKTNAPQQNSSSQPDRGKPKDRANRGAGRNAPSIFTSEARPAAKGRMPAETPRQNQPPSERYLPSFVQPVEARERRQRNEPSNGEDSDGVAPLPPANDNAGRPTGAGQRRGPQGGGGPPALGTNNNATSSSAAYTGGRARQNKERNKSKMKQRGADRKMRGGMF